MVGKFLTRFADGREELIQVCANVDEPTSRKRESQALLEAGRELPRATLNIVALTTNGRLDLPSGIVCHLWLLGKSTEPVAHARKPRNQHSVRKITKKAVKFVAFVCANVKAYGGDAECR